MSDRQSNPQSRAAKIVPGHMSDVYDAFLNPLTLVEWLPPAGMTGKVHDFEARVGGGYSMSLFYPESETTFHGKTSEKEDRVVVRFVELDPPRKIVEAIRFVSDDPAFAGEMMMTATFVVVEYGTVVTLAFDNLPPGVDPKDNDEGARLSLEQLARRFE